MAHRKVSCAHCSHYADCPQETRMYVNYCGSRVKDIEKQVRKAVDDCKSRRGQLFTGAAPGAQVSRARARVGATAI